MRKPKIDFTVHVKTEFGLGLDRRKAHLGKNAEETFMNIWRSLPKRHEKNWINIEFDFEGQSLNVDRWLFRENRFDFNLTVETL